MKIQFVTDKRETMRGWSRVARVGDQDYQVSVSRGKAVRIAYKPRGKNRGWQWQGAVYANGHCLWADRVAGSIGVRGLLMNAGVVTSSSEEERERQRVADRIDGYDRDDLGESPDY
jgi:hypothetical protein